MNGTLKFQLTIWQRIANPPEAACFAGLFVMFCATHLFGVCGLLLYGIRGDVAAIVLGSGCGAWIFRNAAIRFYRSTVGGTYINRIDVCDGLLGVGVDDIQRVYEFRGISIRKGLFGTCWIKNASGVIAVVPSTIGDVLRSET